MYPFLKSFEKIEWGDIQSLLDDFIAESMYIDYKQTSSYLFETTRTEEVQAELSLDCTD